MTHGSSSRSVRVGSLARVEGEGALRVEVDDGQVTNVTLDIFEPPRFFEALLVGRAHTEAPDITARICGICPVAYQMSANRAIEDACSVEVGESISSLRRLLYCGEWIQSHSLHIYLLHAPDFFGLHDVAELAEVDRSAVERGLALKRTGNRVMETIGGRAVHPVNVRVGGFYRAPDPEEVRRLVEPLSTARDLALETVRWVAGFDFPDVENDYLFVALSQDDRYAIESGRIRSSRGLDTDAAGFCDLMVEEQVPHSTALHARLGGVDPYLTGPLARYAISSRCLPAVARQAAADAGIGDVCRNPFRSIVVRAVELVFACDEALRLVAAYEPPDPPAVPVPPRASTGVGATEAPRGLLLHRYVIDDAGTIREARIVPPTSQNQLVIEGDLRRVAQASLELEDDELTRRCELAVRNHDPCISCAAHFLDTTVVRR